MLDSICDLSEYDVEGLRQVVRYIILDCLDNFLGDWDDKNLKKDVNTAIDSLRKNFLGSYIDDVGNSIKTDEYDLGSFSRWFNVVVSILRGRFSAQTEFIDYLNESIKSCRSQISETVPRLRGSRIIVADSSQSASDSTSQTVCESEVRFKGFTDWVRSLGLPRGTNNFVLKVFPQMQLGTIYDQDAFKNLAGKYFDSTKVTRFVNILNNKKYRGRLNNPSNNFYFEVLAYTNSYDTGEASYSVCFSKNIHFKLE